MQTPYKTHDIKHHPIWSSLAQIANDDLQRLLEHFFRATHNLLHELSKHASTNNDATLYLDGLNQLRTHRTQTIHRFAEQLTQQAMQLAAGELNSHAPNKALDLVSSEALDRQIACQAAINNVNNLYHNELQPLVQTLTQISPLEFIPSKEIPLTPEWFANNFASCLPLLDTQITTIAFKQFEKYVLRQLAPLLNQCNTHLENEGLTPNNTTPLPKLADIQTSLDDADTKPVEPSDFSLPLHALRQVLASARFKAANDDALGYRFAFNDGPIMPLPILSTELTQQQLSQAKHIESNVVPFIAKNQVGDYVSRALQSHNNEAPRALSPFHEDIVQLVESFFDELLDDQELTTVSQALICRLQIPILKVALGNEMFFSDALHPARGYINSLTHLAQTLETPQKPEEDALYNKLFASIKRIGQLFDLNEEIFSSELEALAKLEQQEAHRAQIIEQRTCQAEEGRHHFESAKKAAQACISQHLGQQAIQRSTQNFIQEYWQQVLVLTYLKEGKSTPWLAHGQTLKALLWLDQEHTDSHKQQKAYAIAPKVQARLAHGLKLLHLEEKQCTSLSANVVQATLSYAQTTTQNGHLNANPASAGSPRQRTNSATLSRPSAIEKQQKNLAQLEQHFLNIAKNMPVGTWVQMQHQNKTITCKLASNASADNYLFVNRLGSKVLTQSYDLIALALQHNSLKIITREPLFDRLMARALKHLKKTGE